MVAWVDTGTSHCACDHGRRIVVARAVEDTHFSSSLEWKRDLRIVYIANVELPQRAKKLGRAVPGEYDGGGGPLKCRSRCTALFCSHFLRLLGVFALRRRLLAIPHFSPFNHNQDTSSRKWANDTTGSGQDLARDIAIPKDKTRTILGVLQSRPHHPKHRPILPSNPILSRIYPRTTGTRHTSPGKPVFTWSKLGNRCWRWSESATLEVYQEKK
ncbi:hypothetical protein SNOG_02247 [Parastagonospora nodorum SN15]|uniref:Uncharacterized protein n=1 Tax=Phaeosphaeria nodorum (strain SN15 / ATCC MYA-4574 / FGSC 10173) TaxID=321614 RepID=Q0V167_PHANO|nr:hypothetical protein SNOG_02247 [Parastagonospora nodorum SN15]EAT90459.1 hypothetical protein SNOG_02247 [Parastagonospora nodorum SN15]